MRRFLMEDLIFWKSKKNRMPLLLYGARQVGKTYLLQEFGRSYFKNTVYVNLERMQVIADFFQGDLQPERILQFLEEAMHTRIIPGETLLIFDEIQACERALTSLKYFCEETPELHVTAAGSLLGVAINREHYSFPVGKVDMYTLYPLRFDEFLWAVGQEALESQIKAHYMSMEPMPTSIHRELRMWWLRYLFVGGMPAAVKNYVEEHSLVNVPDLQNLIISSYTADMSKYATSGEAAKIRNAYLSLPAQLAKDNKKFQYKLIRKGATAGLFGESITWLYSAGVVVKSDLTTRGEVPVSVFRDISAFKLYLSDVGLLSSMVKLMPDNVIKEEMSAVYKGALAENYAAQTLHTNGYDLFYWTSDTPPAEVDFVIQKEGQIIPIEVKYDENVHARSIKQFCSRYHPKYAIHLTERNFGKTDEVWSVPLYAAYCI